ncbi:MAG: S41 family peptidase [Terrimicrobiaceae bacterium]
MRIVVLLLLLGSLVAPASDPGETPKEDSPYESIQILARAMQLIRQDYVDNSRISYRDLTYSALRGMLAELDPHSQFMEPKDFDGMQQDTRGEFGGLGAVVTLEGGILTIVAPMEDSPTFRAGLEPGDQILRINGKTTEKLSLPDAIDLLRGDVGDKVTLTIRRPSTGETRDYELTRQSIKVPTVKDAQILPSEDGRRIGYLRITQFNEPTSGEVARAIEHLESDGLDALVIDLRYNPGGLLGSAVEICGLFVPEDTLIVSTEGRAPGREYRTKSPDGKVRTYPLVLLVNYASASGSEVMAGALKDLGRAIIVGETTFGKGSVQSVVALPDGSAVRLTTAKYYTPHRDVIHEHGVAPHVRATATPEEEIAIIRSRRDTRDRQPRIKTPESISKDPQLARAVDLLRGLLIQSDRPSSAIP